MAGLFARHEQQETQAQVRYHPDRHVEMHPPQDRGSDQDPAEDLQHDRWHLHSRAVSRVPLVSLKSFAAKQYGC